MASLPVVSSDHRTFLQNAGDHLQTSVWLWDFSRSFITVLRFSWTFWTKVHSSLGVNVHLFSEWYSACVDPRSLCMNDCGTFSTFLNSCRLFKEMINLYVNFSLYCFDVNKLNALTAFPKQCTVMLNMYRIVKILNILRIEYNFRGLLFFCPEQLLNFGHVLLSV